jgi:hypothetical protein
MNKILKASLIMSVLAFSQISIAADKIVITNATYPVPQNSINWEGNYNPKDLNDYWNYKIFLAKKYNASNNKAEKKTIVREQNRARNYSAATFEHKKHNNTEINNVIIRH